MQLLLLMTVACTHSIGTTMASLTDTEPHEVCIENGPGVAPQVVVSWNGVPLLNAPKWNVLLVEQPEALDAFAT